MRKTIKLLALLLALVMVLGLCACGGDKAAEGSADAAAADTAGAKNDAASAGDSGDSTEAAADGAAMLDKLSVGNNGSTVFIGCFDVSGYFNTTACQGAKYFIYDQLFYVNNGEMESRILSDWYYEDDTTLVLQLKDNIFFSNGDQMTPEDVLYSMYLYKNGCWGRNLAKVDLENSYYEGNTIYVKWTEPYAPGVKMMVVSIMNKDFVEDLVAKNGGDEFSIDWYLLDTQCGSGPYICTESVTDSYAIFELRDDYWGMEEYGAPAKVIDCYYYSDQTTMIIEFEQGKIDIAYNVSNTDAERAQSGQIENGALGLAYSNTMISYVFSSIEPDFQDINLRKAFAYALDTAAMTEMAYGVYGIPTSGMMSANMPYYIEGLCFEYNPDLSKELMAAAGVDSMNIDFTCMNVAQFSSLAETTQYYEDQIGIHMNLNILEAIACIDAGMAGGQALWMNNMCDGSTYEPSNMFNGYQTGMTPDMLRLNDTEMMDHISTGLTTLDDAGRREAYEWLQQYMYDQCICVPICDSAAGYIYNSAIMDDPYTVGVNGPNVMLVNLK